MVLPQYRYRPIVGLARPANDSSGRAISYECVALPAAVPVARIGVALAPLGDRVDERAVHNRAVVERYRRICAPLPSTTMLFGLMM
jgi:hypothetical protein